MPDALRRPRVLGLLVASMLAGCGGGAPDIVPQPLPTPTQGAFPTATDAPPSAPSPSPQPATYFVQPGVPREIAAHIEPALSAAGLVPADAPDSAAVRVMIDPGPEAMLTATWVYAVVTPFPGIPDGVAWADLQAYWRGEQAALPPFDPAPGVFLDSDTADLLSAQWGPPSPILPLTRIGPEQSAGVLDLAWNTRPALSIVPFDRLDPRWKVLAVDGQSPLDRALDITVYPLTVQVGVIGSGDASAQAIAALQQPDVWPATNRDPARITSVVMTGVTALSRAVAKQMETRGMGFPAEQIMPFFADADILHTSNEASFTPDCPEQDWFGDPVFCEHREYYELFRTIGLDIVELTGNHNLDYGIAAAANSLDIYDAEGLPYFGGGRTLDDATAPRILTAPDGTRIAFIGCNSVGPYPAWATSETPGAAPCDDWARIQQQIAGLKAADQADVVIATVQYFELAQDTPSDQQRADFEALAAAGADIVSGSQAHQPQGFSFADGRLVHFGVGNLFFDQIDFEENRQMFADKHVFYEGRHISTILFTGYFEEVGQPRPMTPQERADFLGRIFAASGW